MVKTISLDLLKRKLKDIFCNENKATKKYSSVWLTEADFGGLYQSNKYVVNVKAEREISSCNDEIKHIVTDLFKQLAKDELALIWKVVVYNSYEEIHCESDDILVYAETDSCES